MARVRGRKVIAALALACAVAVQAAPPSPAVPAKLTNSVSCVHDAMSEEQREIAQVILLEGLNSGGNPVEKLKDDPDLKALFDEALDACITRFAWSSGRTESANFFALTAMLIQSVQPLLEKDGIVLADIDAYFEANKARLMAKQPSFIIEKAKMMTHLRNNGTQFETRQASDGAEFYFSLLIGREMARRWFAQSSSYRR
jgi:hypothetical protein